MKLITLSSGDCAAQVSERDAALEKYGKFAVLNFA